MITFTFPNEYFSPKATLECGQTFRFSPCGESAWLVLCADKACLLKEYAAEVHVSCEEADEQYFRGYFDLETDYAALLKEAEAFGVPVLFEAVRFGRGLRILNQDKAECLLSFIVSQQNNIPRIKGSLSRLCAALGEKKRFAGYDYYTFPSLERLAERDEDFYRSLGLGYRARYVAASSKKLLEEGFSSVEGKTGAELKRALTAYPGIGNKVADCISLFAFRETAAFTVDTCIARLYRENFGGAETDREKINRFFVEKFGPNAGIFQQYLFYYKRERGDAAV